MVGWLQNNFIVPITAGIITLIIALLEKKFLKEDDNLRELREQQLSSTYGPLKMLLIKYEKNRMDRQELINSIKEIWANYYLFLDNSLNKKIIEIIYSAPEDILEDKLQQIKAEVDSKYNYLRKKVNYEIGIVDYRIKIDYCINILIFIFAAIVVIVVVLRLFRASEESIEIIVFIGIMCAFIFSVKIIWYFLRTEFDYIRMKF